MIIPKKQLAALVGLLFTVCLSTEVLATKAPIEVRLFPAEYGRGNTLPLIRHEPSFAHFVFYGDKNQIKGDVTLVITMPAGTGDYGLLGTSEKIKIDNKAYIRFNIPVPKNVLKKIKKKKSRSMLTVWFETSKMPKSGTIFYHLETGGKSLSNKQADIKMLPPLSQGKLPKNFMLFFTWAAFRNVPEKLHQPVYNMLRRMGLNVHLKSAANNWMKYLSEHLAKDGGKLWGNAKYKKEIPALAGVFRDWEPKSGIRDPRWNDKKIVAAFAKKYKLDPKKLTPKRLKTKYYDKWVLFRDAQIAAPLLEWAKNIHKKSPQMPIAVAQGSGVPLGGHIDYKVYNKIKHLIHLPMIYTPDRMFIANNIKAMQAYLPKAMIMPFISASMCVDMEWNAVSQPKTVYGHLTTSAMLKCVGVALWPDLQRGYDMEYIWEIAKGMHEIASVENFLLKGKAASKDVMVNALYENEAHIKVGKNEVHIVDPQWHKFSISGAYTVDNEIMCYFNNFHNEKSATVAVKILAAKGPKLYIYNPVNRKLLVPTKGKTWTAKALKQGICFEVAPQTLGMIVISTRPPQNASPETISEKAIRTAFNKRSEKAKAETNLESIKNGELEINWADMDGDGSAEIRLANSKQELGFGASGNLWSWKIGKEKREFINRFDGGGAFTDQYWFPVDAKSATDKRSPYELVSRTVKNGKATVIFRRKLTHYAISNMSIEKEYSIKPGETSFELKVTIKNETPDNQAISYWAHNAFLAGKTPIVTFKSANGEVVIGDKEKIKDRRFARADLPPEQAKLVKRQESITLKNGRIILGKQGSAQVIIDLNYNDLLFIMRWWDRTDRARYTLEWVYQKQLIASGHSWSTTMKLKVINPEK